MERFLRRELSFDRIPGVIEEVLSRAPVADLRDLAHVLEVDREARSLARSCLAELEDCLDRTRVGGFDRTYTRDGERVGTTDARLARRSSDMPRLTRRRFTPCT